MKTLRYIWIVAMLSVLCCGVQAVTYGKSYKPQYQNRAAYFHAQASADIPAVRMGSVSSSTMYSGSSLPLAAATGVTTADDTNPSNAPRRPRRIGENDETTEDDEDPDAPGEPAPLGEGILPMMLMAMLFAGFVYYRRKKKVKSLNR